MIAATSLAQARDGVVPWLERRLGHTVASEIAGNEPELMARALSYCLAQQRWFCDQP